MHDKSIYKLQYVANIALLEPHHSNMNRMFPIHYLNPYSILKKTYFKKRKQKSVFMNFHFVFIHLCTWMQSRFKKKKNKCFWFSFYLSVIFLWWKNKQNHIQIILHIFFSCRTRFSTHFFIRNPLYNIHFVFVLHNEKKKKWNKFYFSLSPILILIPLSM